MTKLSFDDGDGVWRTIGGRRIFIRTGESLSSAMKKSGKFKLSNKKKGEVRKENKSFGDLAKETNKEEHYAGEELYDDNPNRFGDKLKNYNEKMANEQKESAKRVEERYKKELNLSQRQKDAGNKLNEKAKSMAKDDINTYLKGNKDNWDSDGDFIRDLANEYGLETDEAKKMFNDAKRTNLETNYQKYVNDTLNNDEYLRVNRPNEYFQKQMKESGVKTFADEIKEMEKQNSKKDGEIKGFKKVSENSFLPIRENETEEEVTKAYNERQEKYRRNLEPEVSKNLRDPRRLWDQDLVDTYIEMNEKGMVNEQKDKFTKDMKTMEGKPLYSPDRIKGEKNSGNRVETISRAEYDKMPNDYKGTLKELVETAEFRGENKQDLIKQYEKMGYDVNKDKTILALEKGGTVLKPVKISDDEEKNGNQITNALRRKAYQKYLREHPTSKITFDDFKDMRNIDK